MPKPKQKRLKQQLFADVNEQAANALLRAVFEFFESNQIPKKTILAMARHHAREAPHPVEVKDYRKLVVAIDDMGVILSTWFSNPEFLDSKGRPVALSIRKGTKTFARLLRVSRARVKKKLALELMSQSPSIQLNADGTLVALRRVFIYPDFRIPRAAFIVERFLATVRKNASVRELGAVALLERSSYVPKIDLASVAPFLRGIEGRGAALMDSIDGEMECRRLRRPKSKNVGEIGVSVFAWTRAEKNSQRRRSARESDDSDPID